jgi:hypothetical protein
VIRWKPLSKEVDMVVSIYGVDGVINAYNKQQRVKSKNSGSSDGDGEKMVNPSDQVTLSKQGLEDADVYSRITTKLIDSILKDDKK